MTIDPTYATGIYGPNHGVQAQPAGFLGDILGQHLFGQTTQPFGAIGGLLGNRLTGPAMGSAFGGPGQFLPFQVDPITAAYAQQQHLQHLLQQQLGPAGWFGHTQGQSGQPFNAIGGLLGNRQAGFGQQQPLQLDPITAAYVQQQQLQQLAQLGGLGNVSGQWGQPFGNPAGGMFGNRPWSPFNVDPITAAYAQQQHLQQQLLANRMLPYNLDPITAAYAQQQQLQQQIQQQLLGNRLTGVGNVLGSGSFLPYNIDPITAAYAQQQPLQQLLGSRHTGNIAGGLVGSLLPFTNPGTTPYASYPGAI